MDSVQNKMRELGQSAGQLGRLLVMVGAPIAAIGALGIKSASDVEEMRSKFNVVFGAMADSTRAWAETTAKAVNRSKFDLEGYLAALQDTFVPMGIARDEATELSKSVVELAVDVGSFNNVASGDVIRDFQSALVGNTETVRKYGVVITENRMKQYALNTGIIESKREMTEQEKILARLNLLFSDTTDAQGDAILTADSFANQMQGLNAAIKEVQVEIGQALLPAITKMLEVLPPLLQKITEFSSKHPTLIKFVAIAAAGITALGVALIAVGMIIPGVVAGYTILVGGTSAVAGGFAAATGGVVAFGLALGRILAPIAAVAAAAAAISATLKIMVGDYEKDIDDFESYMDSWAHEFKRTMGDIVGVVTGPIDALTNLGAEGEKTFDDLKGDADAAVVGVGAALKTLEGDAATHLPQTQAEFQAFIDEATAGFNNLGKGVDGVTSAIANLSHPATWNALGNLDEATGEFRRFRSDYEKEIDALIKGFKAAAAARKEAFVEPTKIDLTGATTAVFGPSPAIEWIDLVEYNKLVLEMGDAAKLTAPAMEVVKEEIENTAEATAEALRQTGLYNELLKEFGQTAAETYAEGAITGSQALGMLTQAWQGATSALHEQNEEMALWAINAKEMQEAIASIHPARGMWEGDAGPGSPQVTSHQQKAIELWGLDTIMAVLEQFDDAMSAGGDTLKDFVLNLGQREGLLGLFGRDVPEFAGGGVVPGPIGSPQLAVVHGGERISQGGGGGGVNLNFYGPVYGMDEFEDRVTQAVRDTRARGGFWDS